MDDFSGRLCAGLSKPARRFVSEALYGIAARGSVRLSAIGRALEETVSLAKTDTRLSRNLGREELRAHVLGPPLFRAGLLSVRTGILPYVEGPSSREESLQKSAAPLANRGFQSHFNGLSISDFGFWGRSCLSWSHQCRHVLDLGNLAPTAISKTLYRR